MRPRRAIPTLVGLAACLLLAARPAAAQPGPHMAVDTPANTASVAEPFQIAGWAIDTNAATGTGVDAVHIWGTPSGGSPVFLGAATYGGARPDVGAAFGSQFTNSAYWLVVANQPIGSWQIIVYAHSTVTGTFNQSRVLNLTLLAHPLMWVDTPVQNAATTQPFSVAGWAVDLAAQTGTGVDAVHVWAYPNPGSGAAAIFLGAATYGGSRPDIGAAYGTQFTNSGFSLTVQNQDPGEYRLIVYARSTVTGTFNQAMTLTVFVDTPTMPLTVDVAGGGTGTVTSSPSGLNCTPATTPCTLNVTPNQAVTLTATPDTEQSFAGWQGGCAGTSPTCQVTVDQAKWAVARFAPAPTIAVTYYHMDALGSVRALSDESGAVVARHDYGAFGEDTAPLTGDPRRFTGKELDPESAWMYFGARYYRNVVGRFTSADTYVNDERALQVPQLWNRYAYVTDSPIHFTDPIGRQRITVAAVNAQVERNTEIRADVANFFGANDPKQSTAAKVVETVADAILSICAPATEAEVASDFLGLGLPIGPVGSGANAPLRLLRFTAGNFRENLARLSGDVPLGMDAHHVFPQRFATRFESFGLEIHDPRFGAWWEMTSHRRAAAGYNAAWQAFLGTDPTLEQALRFGQLISAQYGLHIGF